MMVGFRSWRDTGITWLALAGIDLAKMQRRAGHEDITTTMRYVKAAEDMSGTIGEPFPPLPSELVELPPKATVTPLPTVVRANVWANTTKRPKALAESLTNSAERAGVEPAVGF